MSEGPTVTVAGGGIAGLTAALRLAERGYRVKLYEQKPLLGGNLGSRRAAGGLKLDVYPHMYGNWYHNFWGLMADASGLKREQLFVPVSGVKQLRTGEFPRFTGLTDMYSSRYMLQNLFSGVGPIADMFVFGYSHVDLLAERACPTMLPDDLTVGGFLNARPYMTKRAADAADTFITTVWSIPSYLVSADDYRMYHAYCVAAPIPGFWLARGSAFEQVISHITNALKANGVKIFRSVQVTGVSCRDGRAAEITFEGRPKEKVDELVLAVPPPALLQLVRSGKPERRIIDSVPELAELSRLRTQAIPMLHVYFTRKLRHIPSEPVGLYQSRLGLAFTDISQVWEEGSAFGDRTVLALSSSDPYGLPGTGDADDAMAMLRELSEYVEFQPGSAWGQSPDIDWKRTRYDANADAQLYVNQAGSDMWRPSAQYEALRNVYFAGDFCQNRIGMTTIESAVTTGLQAANSVISRRGIGTPVDVRIPSSPLEPLYVWLRYAWGPYALAAKAWSEGRELVKGLARHLLESWRT
jgi:NAD(P)-binding Rossmann-like domain/Flavin containing amine oxidoreductase